MALGVPEEEEDPQALLVEEARLAVEETPGCLHHLCCRAVAAALLAYQEDILVDYSRTLL